MRDEKMAKKKKEEKTKMNWEGLKQPVKSGVGFREPPQKTCVFRGPRVITPKNLRFRGPRVMHLAALSTLVHINLLGIC